MTWDGGLSNNPVPNDPQLFLASTTQSTSRIATLTYSNHGDERLSHDRRLKSDSALIMTWSIERFVKFLE
ncbi:hypothetical protein TNCV_4971811 [Trichonephila clavipes]|nr:hypothetical protein TNCV_4971811 [Trichonephila clavipes]